MSEKIKPCPFCGHEDSTIENPTAGGFFVRCTWCIAEGPIAYTEQNAINNWNTRDADDEMFNYQEGFMAELCSLLKIPYELANQSDVINRVKELNHECKKS